MIYVETPRLILRDWMPSDVELFIKLNQDPEVMEFFPATLSREETLAQFERIGNHFAEYNYGLFALERRDNNEFIGFTGLSHPRFESYFTPCVEIGWRLAKAAWGNGFATEAARACIDYGINVLQLKEIYSFTSVHNQRSEAVMIKLGMIKQGEFEHPLVEYGNSLKTHVLYKTDHLKTEL